ncbi:MAG TPA: hypothetical protein VKI17_09120 [Gemmataceae bacterium]|nr:hypothetical protein [Gemmataceae bacterium]
MRRHHPYGILALACALAIALPGRPAAAAGPLVEKYLLDGKLSDGAAALQARLNEGPGDDQARFGLGVLQFLQAFEHCGGNLYKYGLRTHKGFLRPPPQLKEFFPQNPNPEKLTYAAARQMLQSFLDDLVKAEATLAAVKDEAVKLPLHVGRIKIDPFGTGKPISAAFLFERLEASAEQRKLSENLVIGFDRGDVSWLRGYCHFLAGLCELLLAVDGQQAFECGAHLLFEKVETPHTFLLEDRYNFPEGDNKQGWPWPPDEARNRLIADAISFLHRLTRLPLQEPARTTAALAHLEAGLGQAKEMWKFILAETDDDNEWVPNPRQKGVLGIKVTQQMVDTWLETLDEADQLLKGKKLLPFWRGKKEERGINLRRVFTEPRTFEPIQWVQGTSATPYLEKGTLTKFADAKFARRLNEAFGGPFNFIGFGFWFN